MFCVKWNGEQERRTKKCIQNEHLYIGMEYLRAHTHTHFACILSLFWPLFTHKMWIFLEVVNTLRAWLCILSSFSLLNFTGLTKTEKKSKTQNKMKFNFSDWKTKIHMKNHDCSKIVITRLFLSYMSMRNESVCFIFSHKYSYLFSDFAKKKVITLYVFICRTYIYTHTRTSYTYKSTAPPVYQSVTLFGLSYYIF